MAVHTSCRLIPHQATYLAWHAETSTGDGQPFTLHALYVGLAQLRQEGVPPTATVNVQGHRCWADWTEAVVDAD